MKKTIYKSAKLQKRSRIRRGKKTSDSFGSKVLPLSWYLKNLRPNRKFWFQEDKKNKSLGYFHVFLTF
jgi:hypothetical protein